MQISLHAPMNSITPVAIVTTYNFYWAQLNEKYCASWLSYAPLPPSVPVDIIYNPTSAKCTPTPVLFPLCLCHRFCVVGTSLLREISLWGVSKGT